MERNEGERITMSGCLSGFIIWLDEQARRLAAREGENNERK